MCYFANALVYSRYSTGCKLWSYREIYTHNRDWRCSSFRGIFMFHAPCCTSHKTCCIEVSTLLNWQKKDALIFQGKLPILFEKSPLLSLPSSDCTLMFRYIFYMQVENVQIVEMQTTVSASIPSHLNCAFLRAWKLQQYTLLGTIDGDAPASTKSLTIHTSVLLIILQLSCSEQTKIRPSVGLRLCPAWLPPLVYESGTRSEFGWPKICYFHVSKNIYILCLRFRIECVASLCSSIHEQMSSYYS